VAALYQQEAKKESTFHPGAERRDHFEMRLLESPW